jgi:aryl-alcohol dehydrogenase-like predicted oxidoreductase
MNGRPAAAAGEITVGDMNVRRMGFGAMRLTGEGIWGEPRDRGEAIRVLQRCVDLGVNFIDTADSYGPEVSERLIGEALSPYPEGMVVATKAGHVRPGPGRWTPNGRPEHIREAVEGSLRRLKLERIDLYQLHRVDPKVPFEDSVGAFAELQKEGKIRHVGLSNISIEQLERAEQIVDFVSVQNLYNLGNRGSEAVLEACERRGIAFLPWAPMEGGNLAGRRGPLVRVAEAHGATPNQIALAWLLHRSPLILQIPGTSSVAHLEENVAAAAIELTEEEERLLDEGSRDGGR